MESQRVDRSVFLEVLGDSLDTDEASETLERAADHAGLGWRDTYTRDEALELADALTELDDVKLFVNISGNTIKARIESGKF
jgi:hypothetical protein